MDPEVLSQFDCGSSGNLSIYNLASDTFGKKFADYVVLPTAVIFGVGYGVLGSVINVASIIAFGSLNIAFGGIGKIFFASCVGAGFKIGSLLMKHAIKNIKMD